MAGRKPNVPTSSPTFMKGFELVNPEATFELTNPEATFEPEDPEGLTKSDFDQSIMSDEDRFLAGEPRYVSSSNVSYFQYAYFYPDGTPQMQLYVGYLDGSVYEYDGVSMPEAVMFYRASSAGKIVWDVLRLRGTVFGYQKPYRLVSGNRIWAQGKSSIARHDAIPKSGEAFKGYHPMFNYKGAPGKMGQTGLNLNAKSGSRKIAYFTPAHVNLGKK